MNLGDSGIFFRLTRWDFDPQNSNSIFIPVNLHRNDLIIRKKIVCSGLSFFSELCHRNLNSIWILQVKNANEKCPFFWMTIK